MTSYSFNYVFRDLILALKFQITEVLETRNSNQAARPSQRGGGATVWARDYTWGVWQQAETVSVTRQLSTSTHYRPPVQDHYVCACAYVFARFCAVCWFVEVFRGVYPLASTAHCDKGRVVVCGCMLLSFLLANLYG